MPTLVDKVLNPEQEQELNSFIAEMKADGRSEDEIRSVVENYVETNGVEETPAETTDDVVSPDEVAEARAKLKEIRPDLEIPEKPKQGEPGYQGDIKQKDNIYDKGYSKGELEQIEKTQQSFEAGTADLSAGQSMVNSLKNGLGQLSTVDDRIKYLYGSIFDDDKARAEASREIDKATKQYATPTVGFTDLKEREGLANKVAGFGAAGFNAVVQFGVSVAEASVPGVGPAILASEIIGGAVKSYNEAKAEDLGISTEELFNRGEQEIALPAVGGFFLYKLEHFGIKGLSKALPTIKNSVVRNITQIANSSKTEGLTEWAQGAGEHYLTEIARGKTNTEAAASSLEWAVSKEGRESLYQGLAGGGGLKAGGTVKSAVRKAASGFRSNAQQEIIEDKQTKIASLEDAKSSPEITPEQKKTIVGVQEKLQSEIETEAQQPYISLTNVSKEGIDQIVKLNDEVITLNQKALDVEADDNLNQSEKDILIEEIDSQISDLTIQAQSIASISNAKKEAKYDERVEEAGEKAKQGAIAKDDGVDAAKAKEEAEEAEKVKILKEEADKSVNPIDTVINNYEEGSLVEEAIEKAKAQEDVKDTKTDKTGVAGKPKAAQPTPKQEKVSPEPKAQKTSEEHRGINISYNKTGDKYNTFISGQKTQEFKTVEEAKKHIDEYLKTDKDALQQIQRKTEEGVLRDKRVEAPSKKEAKVKPKKEVKKAVEKKRKEFVQKIKTSKIEGRFTTAQLKAELKEATKFPGFFVDLTAAETTTKKAGTLAGIQKGEAAVDKARNTLDILSALREKYKDVVLPKSPKKPKTEAQLKALYEGRTEPKLDRQMLYYTLGRFVGAQQSVKDILNKAGREGTPFGQVIDQISKKIKHRPQLSLADYTVGEIERVKKNNVKIDKGEIFGDLEGSNPEQILAKNDPYVTAVAEVVRKAFGGKINVAFTSGANIGAFGKYQIINGKPTILIATSYPSQGRTVEGVKADTLWHEPAHAVYQILDASLDETARDAIRIINDHIVNTKEFQEVNSQKAYENLDDAGKLQEAFARYFGRYAARKFKPQNALDKAIDKFVEYVKKYTGIDLKSPDATLEQVTDLILADLVSGSNSIISVPSQDNIVRAFMRSAQKSFKSEGEFEDAFTASEKRAARDKYRYLNYTSKGIAAPKGWSKTQEAKNAILSIAAQAKGIVDPSALRPDVKDQTKQQKAYYEIESLLHKLKIGKLNKYEQKIADTPIENLTTAAAGGLFRLSEGNTFQQTASRIANLTGITFSDDVKEASIEKQAVGGRILMEFIDKNNGNLVDIREKYDKKGSSTIVEIKKKQKLGYFFEGVGASKRQLSTPLTAPPVPLTGPKGANGRELVSGVPKQNRMSKEDFPKVYEQLDRVEGNPTSVNVPQLELLNGIKGQYEKLLRSKNYTSEEVDFKIAELNAVLNEADVFKEGDIYSEYVYDFRGRMLAKPIFLNHQKSKEAKSLIRLPESAATPLGQNGWQDLSFYAADLFGKELDFDKVMEWGKNPLKNTGWLTEAKDPFNFIAAAVEMYNAVESGDRYAYKSSFVVYSDASNSGAQHIALLTKDAKLAEAVNVSGSQGIGDLYLNVAQNTFKDIAVPTEAELKVMRRVSKELLPLEAAVRDARNKFQYEDAQKALKEYKEDNSNELEVAWRAFIGQKGVRENMRSLAKGPIMTRNYNSGAESAGQDLYKEFKPEIGFEGITETFMSEFSAKLFNEMELEFPVLGRFKKVITKMANDLAKEGKQVSYTLPINGFKVTQNYLLADTQKPLKFNYTGTDKKRGKYFEPRIFIGDKGINKKQVGISTMPNVIHSMDGQIVSYIGLNADYPVLMIHDAFGSTPGQSRQLNEDVRKGYVELYDTNTLETLLTEAAGDAGAGYLSDIGLGTLNPKNVLEDPHTVSPGKHRPQGPEFLDAFEEANERVEDTEAANKEALKRNLTTLLNLKFANYKTNSPYKLSKITQESRDDMRILRDEFIAKKDGWSYNEMLQFSFKANNIFQKGRKGQLEKRKEIKGVREDIGAEAAKIAEKAFKLNVEKLNPNDVKTLAKKNAGIVNRFKKRGPLGIAADFISPTSIDNFDGLLARLLPKSGEARTKAFNAINETLVEPLKQGDYLSDEYSAAVYDSFKGIKQKYEITDKFLRSKSGISVGETDLTNDQIVKNFVYLKDPRLHGSLIRGGVTLEVMDKIVEYVNKNPNLKAFATEMPSVFAPFESIINDKLNEHGYTGISQHAIPTEADAHLNDNIDKENVKKSYEILRKAYDGVVPLYAPYTPFSATGLKETVTVDDQLFETGGDYYSVMSGNLKQRTYAGSVDLTVGMKEMLEKYTNGPIRTLAYLDFAKNASAFFTKKNMNAFEASLGERWKENIQDALKRIVTGRTERPNQTGTEKEFHKWLTRSISSIMFLNPRSAILQLVSIPNFGLDNPVAYMKYATKVKKNNEAFNLIRKSGFAQIRGKGKTDVLLDKVFSQKAGDKVGASIDKLLQEGYFFTKGSDRFAIASRRSSLFSLETGCL